MKKIRKWILAFIVPLVIGMGWFFPVLGFSVPLVMLLGIGMSFWKGRYFCGHFCPRGCFYDEWIAKWSPQRAFPKIFRKKSFRWGIFTLLMSGMLIQIGLHVSKFKELGKVFLFFCTVTTLLGVLLAVLFHHRSWCSFCPLGTLQSIFSRKKHEISLAKNCQRRCKVCEKKCPMQLPILEMKGQKDCLFCKRCVESCPSKALSFPKSQVRK